MTTDPDAPTDTERLEAALKVDADKLTASLRKQRNADADMVRKLLGTAAGDDK